MARLLLLVAAVVQAASGVGAGDTPARGWGGWLARLGSQLQAQPPLRMAGDQALWDAAGGQQVRREGRGEVEGGAVEDVAWIDESRGGGRCLLSAPGPCACLRFASAGRRGQLPTTTRRRVCRGGVALTTLHGTAGRQRGVGARGKRKRRRVHMQHIIMGVLEWGRFFPGHGQVPEGGSNAQSQVSKP
jgi:hypothetical protein